MLTQHKAKVRRTATDDMSSSFLLANDFLSHDRQM